ncbi:MAG: glycosyltransferase family 39 protein [Desulfobacteraceae bacterium]|nr:glycosyltransferase family 39 protein [Desulfobacteraceae bacterium]
MDFLKEHHKKYLLYVLLLGAVLRIWGIWHGYPYSFYPDEAHFVKRALSFGSGDLNPHWFHKPGFLMYLLFFDYGLFFVFGKILGVWHTVTEFAVFYVKNPGPFYIIGRLTIVLFSLGAVLMTYLTGTKLGNKGTGVIAALIVAVSFGHVLVTKDIKADIPCGFFTIVSAYYLIGFLKDMKIRNLLLSAAFAGVGTATKMYSLLMLAPITVAVAGMDGFRISGRFLYKVKMVAYCILLFYFSYFICAPYNFIDPLGRKATFQPFHSLFNKIEMVVTGDKIDKELLDKNLAENIQKTEISLLVYMEAMASYLKVLQKGVGVIVLVLCAAGFFYLPLRRERSEIIGALLYPFLFSFCAVFINPGYSEIRHQVVMYPFLAIISAMVLVKISERIPGKIGLMIVCLLLYPVYGIFLYNIDISGEDTRNLAKEWIEKEIPAETKILVNENGPRLNTSRAKLSALMLEARRADPNGQFTAHFDKYVDYQLEAAKKLIGYGIDEIRLPWWKEREEKPGIHHLNSEHDRDMGNPLKPVGVNPYGYYVKHGYKYVIVHSEQYGAFLNPKSTLSEKFPMFHQFYTELFQHAVLIKEFVPQKYKTQGPVVKIFRIG